MTDTVQLALIASIAPTIAAMGSAALAFAAWQKGKENGAKADTTIGKADMIIEKAVEIHATTNGHLSNVTDALNSANTKIEGLEALVHSMVTAKSIADSLAVTALAGNIGDRVGDTKLPSSLALAPDPIPVPTLPPVSPPAPIPLVPKKPR